MQAGAGTSHKVDLVGKLPVQKLSEIYFSMTNLHDVRHCLLFGFEGNLLNGEEFVLLYDLNTSKNTGFHTGSTTFSS